MRGVLILIQWAGRVVAMMRVGVYLERLENALRNAYRSAPPPVLSWEQALTQARTRRWWLPHSGWHDFGAIAVFTSLAGGSIGLGFERRPPGREELVSFLAVAEAVILVLFTAALTWEIVTARKRAEMIARPRGYGSLSGLGLLLRGSRKACTSRHPTLATPGWCEPSCARFLTRT